jgi:hypothetical protein
MDAGYVLLFVVFGTVFSVTVWLIMKRWPEASKAEAGVQQEGHWLRLLRKITFSHLLQLIIICVLVFIANQLAGINSRVHGVDYEVRQVRYEMEHHRVMEVYSTSPLEVKVAR